MVAYSAQLQESCCQFLEKSEAEILLNVMDEVSYTRGAEIFHKGDPADNLYFLLSGKIAVQNKTGYGDRMQVVALLDPGAPFGEKALFEGGRRGTTITAVVQSELLALHRDSFHQLVETHPSLTVKLLKWLLNRVSLRLEKSSERLVHVL